jgi:hypothetical protein
MPNAGYHGNGCGGIPLDTWRRLPSAQELVKQAGCFVGGCSTAKAAFGILRQKPLAA